MAMKKPIATLALLAGFVSPAYAHTLSIHEGLAALYHQVLGMHHLPITILLVVIGIVLIRNWRKRTD
jgi:heme/copper-type cytochrome/quinol oxidase subunit 3